MAPLDRDNLPHLDQLVDRWMRDDNWDVLNPSPARMELDAVVFDALGLTQGERDAVYEAVIALVTQRLAKAGRVIKSW